MRPALGQPGQPGGEQKYRTAVLLRQFEPSFGKWYERVAAPGQPGGGASDEAGSGQPGRATRAAYVLGSDKDRKKRFTWEAVLPQVTEVQDVDIALAGRVFIVAEFTMEDKPEYKLDRLYSVGGLYPAVFKGNRWETIDTTVGGFHIVQRVGDRELAPFGQFVYTGKPGENQIRVRGNGLAVQPGKYRLKIMSAMAKDWAAHFPSQARICVYFAPDLAAPAAPAALAPDARAADERPHKPCELVIYSTTRPAGSAARVAVVLKNAEQLGDLNATITYPAALLQLAGVTMGPMVGDSIFQTDTSKAGQVQIALAGLQGLAGDGFLCYLNFKVIGPRGRKAPLAGRVTSASRIDDDQKVSIAVVGGQVAIEGALGDGDGDGKITARDALMALQLSAKPPDQAGRRPYDPNLDITGRGEITAQDARWLLQLAVGIRPAGYTGPIAATQAEDEAASPGPAEAAPAVPVVPTAPTAPVAPAAPAVRPTPPVNPNDAYAEYVAAFDELMDLLSGTDIEQPVELRQAQDALRQAEKAFDGTKTPAAYASYLAAHDLLTDLLGRMAIDSPAAVAKLQQKCWAANRKYEQAKKQSE